MTSVATIQHHDNTIKKNPQQLLQIHTDIHEKLKYFIEIKKIPNIIFHGVSGCGKRTIVKLFIQDIYKNNKESIKNYVMEVNCAHGKGIRFIREELKLFARTNINLKDGETFKTIILSNADKLTIDAQSALRRCIELFSHSTRFFIIVEDKYKLLKPILSRFCEIFVPEPIVNNKVINLHKYAIKETFGLDKLAKNKCENLKRELDCGGNGGNGGNDTENKEYTLVELIEMCTKFYEKGYNSLDIIKYIEMSPLQRISEEQKYDFMITFNKIRKEFRNEKLLMLFILHFFLFRNNMTLENISFM
jgi:replication-associated recombination protein RarA